MQSTQSAPQQVCCSGRWERVLGLVIAARQLRSRALGQALSWQSRRPEEDSARQFAIADDELLKSLLRMPIRQVGRPEPAMPIGEALTPSAAAVKRLHKELQDWCGAEAEEDGWDEMLHQICAGPVDDDLFHWHANIWANASAYGSLIHSIDIRFPADYPLKPAKWRFVNDIFRAPSPFCAPLRPSASRATHT